VSDPAGLVEFHVRKPLPDPLDRRRFRPATSAAAPSTGLPGRHRPGDQVSAGAAGFRPFSACHWPPLQCSRWDDSIKRTGRPGRDEQKTAEHSRAQSIELASFLIASQPSVVAGGLLMRPSSAKKTRTKIPAVHAGGIVSVMLF